MLCPRLHLQSSSGSLLPYMEPIRTLWPTSQAVFAWAERDFLQTMKEMTRTMELMDQFHRRLLQEVTIPHEAPRQSIENALEDSGLVVTNGEHFTLLLPVQGFTADELMVRLVGRKLLMLGSKETKNSEGDGSFSYKYEVFRRESDLPENVNLEGLTCSLLGDGHLRIEAPRHTLTARAERNVPIQLTTAVSAAGAAESLEPGHADQSKVEKQGETSKDQHKPEGQLAVNSDHGKTQGEAAA